MTAIETINRQALLLEHAAACAKDGVVSVDAQAVERMAGGLRGVAFKLANQKKDEQPTA